MYLPNERVLNFLDLHSHSICILHMAATYDSLKPQIWNSVELTQQQMHFSI